MYKIRPYKVKSNVPSFFNDDVFDVFDSFFSPRTASTRNFRVDVQDLKDSYLVEAELPGIEKKDINIKYENENLIVSINMEETKEETENIYIHKERFSFSSERRIYLPDVDPKKLNAKLDNGILRIVLNKEEAKINSYMIDID